MMLIINPFQSNSQIQQQTDLEIHEETTFETVEPIFLAFPQYRLESSTPDRCDHDVFCCSAVEDLAFRWRLQMPGDMLFLGVAVSKWVSTWVKPGQSIFLRYIAICSTYVTYLHMRAKQVKPGFWFTFGDSLEVVSGFWAQLQLGCAGFAICSCD